MPLVACNGGVSSLILKYMQALLHELRYSRIPFLSTNSHLSCNYFFCDRNTTASLNQIEENTLSIYSFIVQKKEIYLRPRVIASSPQFRSPLVTTNSGVTSLSLDYPQASRHEICCKRIPFLFLILKFCLIISIKLRVRMRQL